MRGGDFVAADAGAVRRRKAATLSPQMQVQSGGERRRLLSPQMQVQSAGEAAARSVRDQNLLDRVGKTVVANVDDHSVDPDILVGGVERHRHLGAEGLERLL